jgi:hypothetical protein
MRHIDRRAFTSLTLAGLFGGPARAAPTSDIVVPLKLERNLLTVPVTLDGRGPYPFLLASGHLFGQIDSGLAEAVGIQRRALPPVKGITVSGPVTIDRFLIEELILARAWRIRRTELIGRSFPPLCGFRGVFPFTSYFQTTFDFVEPQLRVHRGRDGPPPGGFKAALVQRSGPVLEPPIVRTDLGGKTLKLAVDTGSQSSVRLFPDAVKRLGLWDRYPRGFDRVETDLDGRVTDVRIARGDPLQFAGQHFERPVITMMSPAFAGRDKVEEDGVVGMDVLRRFRIRFDPKRQSAWFWPNTHLGDDFRYDRAGADIEDEVVTRVDAGGPAERAGLRSGDRVLTVNGAADSYAAWSFAGQPGDVVALSVDRDGERKDVRITLEERL